MTDERDTDRNFERAVAAALRESLVRGGPDCPDPGQLGAYLTGGLGPAEHVAIENHLSTCDACQGELALLVRIEPPPLEAAPIADAAAAEPVVPSTAEIEPTGAAPTADAPPSPAEPEPPILTATAPAARPARPMRWIAAPLALAATAVLGVLLTRRLAPEVADVAKRASGVVEKPAAGIGERRDSDSAREEREQGAEAPAAPPAASPVETAPAESDAMKTAPQAAPGAPEGSLGGAAAGSGSKDETAMNDLAGGAPPEPKAAPEAAPAREPAAVPPPPAAAVAQAEPGALGALADAERAKSSQLEKGAAEAPAQAASAAAAAPAESRIPVPGDPRIVWRVRGATIERSDDGGGTWQLQIVARSPLTTGAAVSAKVCWLGGPGGTVLRTVDGTHWTRVAAPGRADVVAVSATSASSATVTLADGTRLGTADGGRSWSKP